MAQASLLDMYHELGDFTGRGTVRFLKNLAVNPSTYFGLGSMGVVKNLLAQGGGKAVRQSMSRRLMRTALGSSILGAEAGAYGLGADYILQVLEHGGIDEPFVWDTNRSLMAAGIGFVGGTDHHGGYPGHYGEGRTALYAPELTRQAVMGRPAVAPLLRPDGRSDRPGFSH